MPYNVLNEHPDKAMYMSIAFTLITADEESKAILKELGEQQARVA